MFTDYTTRNIDKGVALFNALHAAGFIVNFVNHGSHVHVVHDATVDEFATARASIGIPSSIDAAVSAVTIPDNPGALIGDPGVDYDGPDVIPGPNEF